MTLKEWLNKHPYKKLVIKSIELVRDQPKSVFRLHLAVPIPTAVSSKRNRDGELLRLNKITEVHILGECLDTIKFIKRKNGLLHGKTRLKLDVTHPMQLSGGTKPSQVWLTDELFLEYAEKARLAWSRRSIDGFFKKD